MILSTPDAIVETVVPVAYLVPEEPASSVDEFDPNGTDQANSEEIASPIQPARTGSPFRDERAKTDVREFTDVVMPQYPDNVIRENLAVASVVVAVMSLIASIGTAWSLIPAAVGLGLGILGLRSERRRTAIVGIILTSLAIFFGTWKTIDAVHAYYERYEIQQMDRMMGQ